MPGPLAQNSSTAVNILLSAYPNPVDLPTLAAGMGTVPNGASRTLGALVRRGLAERVSLRVNGRRRVAFRAGDASHGSDANRFVPGAWPGCRCGYRPRDNAKLNQHFAEHGFREVDEHGQLVRYPAPEVS